MKNNKILLIFILVLIAISIFIYIFINLETEPNNQSTKTESIVYNYFKAWDEKNYVIMYDLISDGFKKIDENAKDLKIFKKYASAQGIEGITINEIKQTSNNGKTATVDYKVLFELTNGNKSPFEGTFTLKFRETDNKSGWKLIHPYGENIDTS